MSNEKKNLSLLNLLTGALSKTHAESRTHVVRDPVKRLNDSMNYTKRFVAI